MQPFANRISISQAVDGFLLAKAAEGRSRHTLADYRYCFGLLLHWLGADVPVDSITTESLRRFLASLQGRLSPKTVKNVHTALASLWTWLGQELGLPHVVKGIRPPKANPPAWHLPTREDIERLLKACDCSVEARPGNRRAFHMKLPLALRNRCIILVLVDSGLRAQELCSLTLADVDLATGSILVRHGKGNKQRIVYIGKATRRLLWRYVAACRKGARPEEPFFVNQRGKPLTVGRLTHLVRDLGRRAGVKVWPHLLRHVFATEFLRGGGNLLTLQRLLGHASTSLLARYAEIAQADLRAAHEAASPADRWRL